MRIGLSELIFIIIIIMALISPDKLNEIASKAGSILNRIAKEKENLKTKTEPVSDTIKDAISPVTDIKENVDDVINETKNILK